jgi:hypothetical protein
MSKLVGQGYDGASNMSGRLNGVGARIADEYPAAIYVHCNKHCLQLCVQDSGSESRCVQDALNLCSSLHSIIQLSPKHLAVFEKVQPMHSDSTIGIKPLCPTRWTVRARAISSVLGNYEALQETLDVVVEENKRDEVAAKASGVIAQMDNFHTLFGLCAARVIFSVTDQSAVALQGKDISAHEVSGIITSLVAYLNSMRESFDEFWREVVQEGEAKGITISMPRQRKVSKKVDDTGTNHVFDADTPHIYYRQQYYALIDAIIGQMQTRFNQASLELLSNIESMLLDAANGRLQSTATVTLPEALQLYDKILDMDKLSSQLPMLRAVIETAGKVSKDRVTRDIKTVSSVRCLANILNCSDFGMNLCSEIYTLCMIYLAVPMTSATAERSFSTMRRIKTYLRQTMKQQRLNDCMLLHIHKQYTDKLDFDEIARLFVSKNSERLKFFGHLP